MITKRTKQNKHKHTYQTLCIGAMYGSTSRSQLRIKQPNNFALSSLHLLSALLTLQESSVSDTFTDWLRGPLSLPTQTTIFFASNTSSHDSTMANC
jgi:hypothetical protein